MHNAYAEAAMLLATYEHVEDGSVIGSIPGFAGLWVSAQTEDACRRELRDALEGWITLRTASHTPLPPVKHSSQG